MSKVRLDVLLVDRGLFESRARAAAAVLAGDVLLLPGRERAQKAGQMVAGDAELEVAAAMPFVSRGGVKLANALDGFGLEVKGALALDVGASTGGFTDCLLQRGAEHVVALDVAYGELSWKLREDPRVTVLERRNARAVTPADLPYAPTVIVIDVSFISLTKVLPAVLACAAASRFDCLAMIKPQFEVGRDRIGKGGVVREADFRREALLGVGRFAMETLGVSVCGYASSGLPGPKGNRETFLWLAESGRTGALAGAQELETAALAVEP
jgi:23S rRNA (cytidine1920-2'-O)/16S rRNA (cytidine1409-2'-O)-methyltransferase